jgi:hypothetical protein
MVAWEKSKEKLELNNISLSQPIGFASAGIGASQTGFSAPASQIESQIITSSQDL